MGNPWIARFDSSSSSSSSTRPSSPSAEKKEEDGTKRKKKSNFLTDPATYHNHSSSAFERHFATMGTRAWAYWTFITGERIKRKEKFFIQNGGFLLQQKISSCRTRSFKIFTAKELERATENYSASRILGQGGLSVVYKGTLPDNRTVAIKKSKIVDACQIEQFINEIDILSQINHRNVVKLLGCCLEYQVPLLVYEFISNGTLYTHIHGTGRIQSISLQNRLRIATETAEALAYLHSAASIPIVHRDVKSTNILLDDNLIAKVSDFGALRLVPIDQTQITTLVQGTSGYLDPEYFQTGQLTAKSDVYSFGVVLVELLTAKKPICLSRSQEDRNLAMYFISAMKENRLLQVLEDQVRNEGHETPLIAIAQLAKRCLKVRGEERPTMKEVVVELQGLRGFQYHPWVNNNLEEAESLLGGAYNEGNPCITQFDSSSSSSSSIRPSSPGSEKKEEDGTKRIKKSIFLMDPAGTCLTSIKRERIKREEKLFQQNGGFLLQQKISSRRTESFKIFTAEELERATESYSVSRIVGQGGYGVVYKGTLADNRTVAIKKCKVVDASHIEQFKNEIDSLSQINHRNVVKLLGCCLEDEDPLLVYEFISNGTLYTHIHETGHIQSISLQNRLRIAIEIAEALAYLHSAASIQIFHRDVKSMNILLDDNLTAKVSDLGSSILVPFDRTQITTLVQGTLGYLDPEYFQTGQLTAKSDVYSFGVVLVELLTAEKPICLSRSQKDRSLAMHFISAMEENRLFQVLEDQVRNEGHETQLIAIAQLAKRCLKVKGEERPTMKEVALELQGLRGSQYRRWVNNNLEEAESLLGGASQDCTGEASEQNSLENRFFSTLEDGL
ncbi:hypothetical protein AAC387_Pa03g2183 [Persea americana]